MAEIAVDRRSLRVNRAVTAANRPRAGNVGGGQQQACSRLGRASARLEMRSHCFLRERVRGPEDRQRDPARRAAESPCRPRSSNSTSVSRSCSARRSRTCVAASARSWSPAQSLARTPGSANASAHSSALAPSRSCVVAAMRRVARELADRLEHEEAPAVAGCGPGSCRRATASVSRSASQTCSAASSVQPPAKTASRREELAAPRRRAGRSSTRSSRAASAAARGRRGCRRQEGEPLLQPGERAASGSSSLTRAAASSIARGSPSSRRQIAANVLVGLEGALDEPARARRRARPRRLRQRLDSAYSCSPATCSGSRLVTSSVSVAARAAAARRGPAPPRRPARSCRAAAAVRCRARCVGELPSRSDRRGDRRQHSAGSRTAESGTHQTPCGKSSTSSAADLERDAGLAAAARAGQRDERARSTRAAASSSASSRCAAEQRRRLHAAGSSW